MESLSVSISGPAYALLMHETTKSNYCQEGFLLGEIKEKRNCMITDNEHGEEQISRTVSVESFISCPNTCFFYNSIGVVDKEKLQEFLGETADRVVAWYKFKPLFSSNVALTLRENIIHHHLAKYFSVTPELFLYCLITTESSENSSTHSYTQTFIRHNIHTQPIPVHIKNLSDLSSTYIAPEPSSTIMRDVLHGLKSEDEFGLLTAVQVQNTLTRHLSNIVEGLSEAEAKMFQLEIEVKKLKDARKNGHIENDKPSSEKEIQEKTNAKGKKRSCTNSTPKKNLSANAEGIATRLRKRN